jgi:hypothetical protein
VDDGLAAADDGPACEAVGTLPFRLGARPRGVSEVVVVLLIDLVVVVE